MDTRRTTAMCRALLVLLIVVAGAAVSSGQSDNCWKDDDHHPICVTDDCVMTCRDHGHEGGRCNWGWGRLLPHCQCLLANCN